VPKQFGVLAAVCLLCGASATITQSADHFVRKFETVAEPTWREAVHPVVPAPTYAIEGLALGSRLELDSSAYREYKCTPSDQFDGFTWCQKWRRESTRGSPEAKYSILYSPDGTLVYINRYQRRAAFYSKKLEREIESYSREIAEAARITRMPRRSGLFDAVLATWGKVELETLDDDSVRLLTEGKSPKKGLLIDFIGNLTRSAQEGFPIYRILGSAGLVWAASFDRKGRGVLRSAAVDASSLQPGPIVTQPANASRNDDQQLSLIERALASTVRVSRDAEATVARLRRELSRALEAKVEAELSAQKAKTDAEIVRNELGLAMDDANGAKEEVDKFKAGDGTSYMREVILMSTFMAALLLLAVLLLSRMLGASTRGVVDSGKADTEPKVRRDDFGDDIEEGAVALAFTATRSPTRTGPSIDQDDVVKKLARTLGVQAPLQGEASADCELRTFRLGQWRVYALAQSSFLLLKSQSGNRPDQVTQARVVGEDILAGRSSEA
jgi:hypothetical protein